MKGAKALIIGGTHGMGAGVAGALTKAGAEVYVVGRSAGENASFRRADIREPGAMLRVMDEVQAQIIVLAAGALPIMRPIVASNWDAFSVHWHSEVRATFELVQEAASGRLVDGARVVVFSSGAAISGSPLSGGYASSKQTQRFLCGYGSAEAATAGVNVRIQCLLPSLTPHTRLGRLAIDGYAKRAGISPEEFASRMPVACTPAIAGASVVQLLRDPSLDRHTELRLDGEGLHELD